jgi:hypothetical protein
MLVTSDTRNDNTARYVGRGPRLPRTVRRIATQILCTRRVREEIVHTASGQDGGWFAVEITWHEFVVLKIFNGGGYGVVTAGAPCDMPESWGIPMVAG